MARISVLMLFVSFLFLLSMTNCVEDEVKITLIDFLGKLSDNNSQLNSTLDWKQGTDPCKDHWQGVRCDEHNVFVSELLLDRFNLAGILDAAMLCNSRPLAATVSVLSLDGNNITGGIGAEIGNCSQLTRVHVSGNRLSGNLPSSLAMLNNLKGLDVSNNKFSGELPDLSRISGLNGFLAQNNQFSGKIPKFLFSNLIKFNVTFNNLSGQIPDVSGYFFADSFVGNPGLSGYPLSKNCSTLTVSEKSEVSGGTGGSRGSGGPSKSQIIMYSGCAALGLIFILVVVYKLCSRKKTEKKVEAVNEVAAHDHDKYEQLSIVSSEHKTISLSKSEFSVASESGMISQSLVVLTRPAVNEFKFEDLLRAPAELLGRGKYGSLYKVMPENGMVVVVKRIKDLNISSQYFKERMRKLSQLKHPHVLTPLAFYCSTQEKLLVYEYQQNGSLFKLLHGTPKQPFDWTSRLGIAATIAQALAFMHQELREDGIAHSNLKSSNILLDTNMDPCLSEYSVMVEDDTKSLSFASTNSFTPGTASESDPFKVDVYGFGVILLELLTGKLVKSNGIDLTDWVQSVVREEWTGEVFDKSLIREYASEERMVSLLQVAIKCVNRSPAARPGMDRVALMINTIKEDEEKSLIYGAYSSK